MHLSLICLHFSKIDGFMQYILVFIRNFPRNYSLRKARKASLKLLYYIILKSAIILIL